MCCRGGEPKAFKKMQSSKWNKDLVEEGVAFAIDLNDNGGDNGGHTSGIGVEVEEILQRSASNNKKNLGARLLDPLVNLEIGDVRLNFHLKMLEFMNFVNQEIKCGKEKRARQEKVIELLIMQGTRSSSLTKKLAKANMPSTFFGFDKVKKVIELLLEMDRYCDVQKPKEEDKVSIAVTFLKDHAF